VSVIVLILGIVAILFGVGCLLWRNARLRRARPETTGGAVPAKSFSSALTPAMLLGRGIGSLASGVVIVVLALTGVVR
jgi:hypothetical protein